MVLLTGGSGFIGSRIGRLLYEKGYKLRFLSRKTHAVQPGQEVIIGDIRNPEACNEAMQNVRIVIHAAGAKIDVSEFCPVNVQGTINLVNAALGSDVERFIHISSVGVLGADPFMAKENDEDTSCHPQNAYERSKWEAEQVMHRAIAQGLPVVILRPANVFGDGDPHHGLLGLIKNVSRRRFIYLGGRRAVCNYICVEDVAHACIAAINHPCAVGNTYHLSDDCSLEDFIRVIAEETSVAPSFLAIPEFVVTLERFALHRLHRSWRFALMNRLVGLNNRARFSTPHIARQMDFHYPVGWREGLRRVIAHYRREGFL